MADFIWAPGKLNAAIASAFRPSVYSMQQQAMALRHNRSKTGVRVVASTEPVGVVKGTGLAATFEGGRKGGYDIFPGAVRGSRRSYSSKKGATFRVRSRRGGTTQALAGGGFGPYSHVVGGSMRPYPFLGPAAQSWANGLYQAHARRALVSRGFR